MGMGWIKMVVAVMGLMESAKAVSIYPERFCFITETMSGMMDNKIYVFGGYIKDIGQNRANNDIIIVDFTKDEASFDGSDMSLIKKIPLNEKGDADVFKWGSVYARNKKLYVSQGEAITQASYDFASESFFKKTAFKVGGRQQVYDFSKGDDSFDLTVYDTNQVAPNSITRVGYGFSKKTGMGFTLGGRLEGTGIQTPQLLIQDTNKVNSWKNLTTPSYLQGIEIAEIEVLDQYGDEGVLIVFGGVTVNNNWEENDNSLKQVHVYDIASDTWYIQPTRGLVDETAIPSPRTHSCTVSVPSKDGTSHNIYMYAGHNNRYDEALMKSTSEVWVLSIPSFTWTLVSPDGAGIAQYDHTCQLIDDKYLVSFGGKQEFYRNTCSNIEAPLGVDLFDLTALKWTKKYTSSTTGYRLPEQLYKGLNGTAEGATTIQAPKDGFVSKEVEKLFPKVTVKLPSKNPTSDSSSSDSDSTPNSDSATSDTPTPDSSSPKKKVPTGTIIGAVIGGLALLAICALLLFLFLRRRRSPKSSSEKTLPPVEMPGSHLLPSQTNVATEQGYGVYEPAKEELTVRSELMGSGSESARTRAVEMEGGWSGSGSGGGKERYT